jgi:hypothetical protein
MRRPYSVLLPVGFAVPPPLPEARCAFTAPFRPGRAETRWFVFCGTVPCPGSSPGPPGVTRHRSSLEPGLSSRMQLPAYRRSPDPLAGMRLGFLEHRGNPLPAADAHCFQTVTPAAPVQFIAEIGKNPPACRANGVAKRNARAVDVEA